MEEARVNRTFGATGWVGITQSSRMGPGQDMVHVMVLVEAISHLVAYRPVLGLDQLLWATICSTIRLNSRGHKTKLTNQDMERGRALT